MLLEMADLIIPTGYGPRWSCWRIWADRIASRGSPSLEDTDLGNPDVSGRNRLLISLAERAICVALRRRGCTRCADSRSRKVRAVSVCPAASWGNWRRGEDSNLRCPFEHSRFPSVRDRPALPPLRSFRIPDERGVRLWGDKTANRAKVKYRAYRANRVFHNSRVFNTARRTHKTLKKSALSENPTDGPF